MRCFDKRIDACIAFIWIIRMTQTKILYIVWFDRICFSIVTPIQTHPNVYHSSPWAKMALECRTCIRLIHCPLWDVVVVYFKSDISKLIITNNNLGIHCENAPKWMQWNTINEKLTSVYVLAWCLRTPSHCPNQCWSSSISSYGVTWPQCVNEKKWLVTQFYGLLFY